MGNIITQPSVVGTQRLILCCIPTTAKKMKFLLLLIITVSIFICSCHKRNDSQWVDPAKYRCYVTINGNMTDQGILIGIYKDSLLSLAIERTTSDGLYWALAFSPFSKKNQDLTLHKFLSGRIPYAHYDASCCVPPVGPGPDVPEYQYSIWEHDSLTNILHINVDTSSKYLSGHFMATFINDANPYDTVRMTCDSFSCYWN